MARAGAAAAQQLTIALRALAALPLRALAAPQRTSPRDRSTTLHCSCAAQVHPRMARTKQTGRKTPPTETEEDPMEAEEVEENPGEAGQARAHATPFAPPQPVQPAARHNTQRAAVTVTTAHA